MKKLLLLFAAILMASTEMWAETVDYLYPVYNTDGVPTSGIKEWKTAEVNATVVTSSGNNVTWGKTGETTWYVVNGTNVVLSEGVICQGDVRLILADGAKFTATGRDIYCDPGIQVSGEGNSLTIYGQTNQTGQLIANGDMYGAGIGGGKAGSGSNITINGGMVTANGASYAAGIGGGYNGSGSNITINGGTVTANGGGLWAAGIGGGNEGSGSNITINGGTVTANGGDGAAAIGSGYDGAASSNIFVATRFIVKADGNNPPTTVIENTGTDLAGSLAGKQYATVEKMNLTSNDFVVTNNSFTYDGEAKAATVVLNVEGAGEMTVAYKQDGVVVTPVNAGEYDIYAAVAEGVSYKALEATQIGTLTIAKAQPSAENFLFAAPENLMFDTKGKKATIIFDDQNGKLTGMGEVEIYYKDKDGNEFPSPIYSQKYTALINISEGMNYTAAKALTSDEWAFTITPHITTYVDENGELKKVEISDYAVITSPYKSLNHPWCVVIGEVNAGSINIIGPNVHLILADGAKLTVTGGNAQAGIQVSGGCSLTIYGQSAQTGQLIANGGELGAGIGGGSANGSNITINGGIITATGGGGGAGIGGGSCANGSNITINGGIITATGGLGAAGIGGGINGSASNITINGGVVTATGGLGAAGIGGGLDGSVSNIFVSPILTLKAGSTENSIEVIENTGGDLAGKLGRYVTVSDAVCNITANQDPAHDTHYYSTFYSGKKAYSVPEGVTAYTGVVDGSVLKLTAIADGVIPAGEAVILRLTTEDKTETLKKFALTATTTTATKSDNNALAGTDIPMTLGTNDYALSLGQNGVGFYQWDGNKIDAHKAYLTLTASAGANAFVFQFEDGETTGILKPVMDEKKAGPAYNLNGVRVNDNYKGIVIKNGKKIYQK